MRKYIPVIAALLIVAGIAFGQATLGNVVQLGKTDESLFPTPSSSFQGGLIFGTDAGVPYFTNGSSWTALGGGGSTETYWRDAGSGMVRSTATRMMCCGATPFFDGGFKAEFTIERRDAGGAVLQLEGYGMSWGASTASSYPGLIINGANNTNTSLVFANANAGAGNYVGVIYGAVSASAPYGVGLNYSASPYAPNGRHTFISNNFRVGQFVGGSSAGGFLVLNDATTSGALRVKNYDSQTTVATLGNNSAVTSPLLSAPHTALYNANASGITDLAFYPNTNTLAGAVSGYTSATGNNGNGLTLSAPSGRGISFNPNVTSTSVTPIARFDGTTRALTFDTAAGNDAIALTTNNARIDFGTGSVDYIVSSGTELQCGSNVYAPSFEAGADGMYIQPVATASFPMAYGPTAAGHMTMSSDHDQATGAAFYVHDGQNWRPMGMGRNYGAQKKALYLETAIESTAAHKVRLPVLASSGSDVSWVCEDFGTVVSDFADDRPFRESNTSASANDIAYCHTGNVVGTLELITQRRARPVACGWVYIPASSDLNVRMWWGFADSASAFDHTDTPTGFHVMALRYSTDASDSSWKLVTCDSSTCTVTDTTISVSDVRTFLLCLDASGDDGNVRAFVNGYAVEGARVTNSTNLPTSTTWLGFVHYVEALTAASKGFGLSNLSVEMN